MPLGRQLKIAKWNQKPKTGDIAIMFNVKGPKDMSLWYHGIQGADSTEGSCDVVDENGRKLEGWEAVLTRFDNDQTTTTVKFGAAAGVWKTIAEHDDIGSMGIDNGITFTKTIKYERGVQIFTTDTLGRNVTQRIVVIDNESRLHPWEEHTGSVSTGSIRQSIGTFPNLGLDQINKFQFQTRPYEWVTFKNVSLKPKFKTDVQVEVGRARPNSSLESKVNEPADKYNQILEPLNRQRQELEKELKALRDAYDDTEHLTGVRLTVSNAELETVGWLRKRYVASGVVRCEMPNQSLMQAETAIWPDSFEVHAARTAAYLKDRDFLQGVIRRDKVRRTKWFQARKKDMEKAIDSLADSLTVQVKDTADIEVKFTADNPGDAQTILDELLQLFILQQTDQAQNELTKKMAALHEEKNRLKRSIQFMEGEKQTLQKEVQETQKPDVQVEVF